MTHPIFDFMFSMKAAKQNSAILKSFDFDIEKAIQAQSGSPCLFGSEFRAWFILKPLLHSHPLWNEVKTILHDGATFPLNDIPDEDHHIDLNYMLKRRNHKSVLQGHDTILELIEEDVSHGFSLPLTLDCAQNIPKASVAPLGLVEQDTIDEFGNIVKKTRMTHDQSFPGPSKLSVNKRV